MDENIFFLDTNILLDYLEDRNKDIKKVLEYMIDLNKNGKLMFATSVFNVAELLDKELDIKYFYYCIQNKFSIDEARKKKGDYFFYKSIAHENRFGIEKQLNNFIEETELKIFMIPCDDELVELYNLLCENCLQSQDAIIVSTAIYNESDYFLTNDKNLIHSIGNKIYTFDLSDEKQRETFVGRVLKSL